MGCRLNNTEAEMLAEKEELRVDPRIRRTRQMLQQALLELMREKGFQSITVHDIAERATVNRATFYDHFVDKFALLESVMRDTFDTALSAKLAGNASLSYAALKAIVLTLAEFIDEGHRHCSPSDEQTLRLAETQVVALICETLLGWLTHAKLERDAQAMSKEMTATILAWATFGAVHHWQADRHRQPAAEFADQVVPNIAASLHHSYHFDEYAPAD